IVLRPAGARSLSRARTNMTEDPFPQAALPRQASGLDSRREIATVVLDRPWWMAPPGEGTSRGASGYLLGLRPFGPVRGAGVRQWARGGRWRRLAASFEQVCRPFRCRRAACGGCGPVVDLPLVSG